jgi:hypothetical protein
MVNRISSELFVRAWGFSGFCLVHGQKIRKTLAAQGFSSMEKRGLEPLTSTLPEVLQLINCVK